MKTWRRVGSGRGTWSKRLRFLVAGSEDRMATPLAVDAIPRFRKRVVSRPGHVVHITGQGGEALVRDDQGGITFVGNSSN